MDAQTQWRGQPDARRWRLFGLLGVSLALHSVLTPWAALLGLLGWLGMSAPVEARDLPPITAIPIDIIEDEPVSDSGKPEEPADSTTTSLDPASAAEQTKPEPPEEDGKEPSAPEGDADEPKAEEPAAEAGKEVGDPVALSGSAGKLADTNANVRIKVDTEKVRRHSLGPRIGEVLGRVPQWHDFLGPAKLDPIRDLDRMLIAGPQLRDSSEVVAVLQYNVDETTMHAAIDSLVQRSDGEWVSDNPKAATARADRAERIFSFIAPRLIAIVPPSAKADALRQRPKGASFPAIPGDVVLTAVVETPHQVYTGLPFRFPETLKWIRASVTPDAEGGAVARIEAEDESEEQAREHAAWLERRITSVTSPQGLAAAAAEFLYGGSQFIDSVEFVSDGSRIQGTISVTARQLNIILTMVEGIINTWNPKPKPPLVPSASASPSAQPPTLAPPGSAPAPLAPSMGTRSPTASPGPIAPAPPAPSGRTPP